MADTKHLKIAVIGAGMSGILTGIKLRQAGLTDFTIYEKSDRLGGTWRDNTYPGLSCDVPSHLYNYSFEPNPEWSHRFSPGAEIQAYFEGVAKKYAVEPFICFNKEIASARYIDGKWQIDTKDGDCDQFDIVIAATGVLHHPVYPDIEGLDSFAGPAFHSGRWDHGVALKDKRIGIIGTGSTAIQILPAIIDTAAKVCLFQRTAQWIFPLPNPAYSEQEKAEFRKSPKLMKQLHKFISGRFEETFARAVVGDEEQLRAIEQACQENLDENVTDPDLKRKLTPNYKAACKRLIMSDDFYPAIQKPNADLVAEGIERIEPNGVRTTDGVLHELDVLVLATGFDGHRFMRPMQVTGKDGLTLDDAWSYANEAYRSVSVPGFPNFFMLVGPNSPIGNYSLIDISELQLSYVMQLIDLLRAGACTEIAANKTATDRFNAEIKAAMKGTVWVSGCQSWYLDKNGNPAMWPWTFDKFRADMDHPVLEEFDLVS